MFLLVWVCMMFCVVMLCLVKRKVSDMFGYYFELINCTWWFVVGLVCG